MFTSLLGLIDLAAALVFLSPSSFPQLIVRIIALALLFKGGMFTLGGDIASVLDVLIALYLFLILHGFSVGIINILALIFLLQKGLLSFV